MGGRGGQKCRQNDSPFFRSKIMNPLLFFDSELKKCFRVPTPWGLYGAEWDERFYAVYVVFSHFCYVGGSGGLGDPTLPTPRAASGDVVTVYAYKDTKGPFLQSLALPRAGQNPC